MVHEFEKGFSVRQAAWHGLATVLDNYPGRQEAMELAGHNFRIVEKKLAGIEVNPENAIDVGFQPIEGWKALQRSDTNKIISVVRDTYQVVQNETLWDIVDMLVDQPHIQYETAGVLREGAVLWVLAKLDEPITIPGDNTEIYPYVRVSTSHDGTSANEAAATMVRVICMNTFQMSDMEGKRTGLTYRFKHTKNAKVKIEEAKAAIGLVRNQFHAFHDLASELAKKPISDAGIRYFLHEFIPDPPAAIETDRVKKNIEEARVKVRSILEGDTIAETHRNTAYGLFEAGIEYLDHIRKFRTDETYFRRTVIDRNTMKGRVIKLALKAAVE